MAVSRVLVRLGPSAETVAAASVGLSHANTVLRFGSKGERYGCIFTAGRCGCIKPPFAVKRDVACLGLPIGRDVPSSLKVSVPGRLAAGIVECPRVPSGSAKCAQQCLDKA